MSLMLTALLGNFYNVIHDYLLCEYVLTLKEIKKNRGNPIQISPTGFSLPTAYPVDFLIVPVDDLFNLTVIIPNCLIVLIDRLSLLVLYLPD